jgi:hypothetical protein
VRKRNMSRAKEASDEEIARTLRQQAFLASNSALPERVGGGTEEACEMQYRTRYSLQCPVRYPVAVKPAGVPHVLIPYRLKCPVRSSVVKKPTKLCKQRGPCSIPPYCLPDTLLCSMPCPGRILAVVKPAVLQRVEGGVEARGKEWVKEV